MAAKQHNTELRRLANQS